MIPTTRMMKVQTKTCKMTMMEMVVGDLSSKMITLELMRRMTILAGKSEGALLRLLRLSLPLGQRCSG